MVENLAIIKRRTSPIKVLRCVASWCLLVFVEIVFSSVESMIVAVVRNASENKMG